MMTINIKINKHIINSEAALSFFTSLLFLRGVFVDTLGTVFGYFGIPTSPVSTVFYLAMWICLLFSIPHIISSGIQNIRLWCFLGISLLVMLLSITIYPDSSYYVNNSLLRYIPSFRSSCLIGSLLFVFVGTSFDDFDNLLKNLTRTARLGVILAVIRTVFKLFILFSHRYDDMGFAYELCLLICIICADFMIMKSKDAVVFLSIGFIILLLSGTRGPIVAVLCFILIAYIFQGSSIKKTLTTSLVLLAFGLCVWFGVINSLVESLSALFNKSGISLRILDMYLTGSLIDDSGRQAIQENIIPAIWQHPFFGNGVGMDQALYGSYAHNIIIELVFDFGIPIGLAFVVWILIRTYKAVRYGEKSYRGIILILFCSTFIKMLFSQTYITSPLFFVFIGMLLKQKNFKLLESADKQRKTKATKMGQGLQTDRQPGALKKESTL